MNLGKSPSNLLLPLVRQQTRRLVLAIIATLAVTGSTLAMPWLARNFISNVLTSGLGDLTRISLVLLSLFLVQGIFAGLQTYLVSKAGHSIVYDLTVRVYARVQRFPAATFDRLQTGELVSRAINDTSVIRRAVSNNIVDLITQLSSAVGALVLMFILDWHLTLAAAITVPIVLGVAWSFGRRVRMVSREAQQSLADLTTTMNDNLAGIRVIKAFAQEDYEELEFASRARTVYENSLRQARLVAALRPLVIFAMLTSTLAVLYYGSVRVTSGAIAPGDLVAFLLYVFILSGPAGGLSALYADLQQALAAADRVSDLLSRPIELDKPSDLRVRSVEGRVSFEDVSFSYQDDRHALTNVTLTAEAGQVVALVGPSGAGKSTLAALLNRFYEPSGGRICLDGIDVGRIKLQSLRSTIGFVAQDIVLFPGTLRDNIRFGNRAASDEQVEEAARAANAAAFIEALPQTYDTLVGERGIALSGGQRQRIAIARTLLSNPAVLVLDEATSSLDNESEAQVQAAITRLMKGRTTLVIAHRLSTVVDADKIVVLDKGAVVSQGTHHQLLDDCEIYRRMYAKNVSGEMPCVVYEKRVLRIGSSVHD